MSNPNTGTVLSAALALLIPDKAMRTGFMGFLRNNAAGEKRYLTLQTGVAPSRVLVAFLPFNAASQRELKSGRGFEYVGADGKAKHTNLADIGWEFSMSVNPTDASLYAFETLTVETADKPLYDVFLGRVKSEPKTATATPTKAGKAGKSPSKPSKRKYDAMAEKNKSDAARIVGDGKVTSDAVVEQIAAIEKDMAETMAAKPNPDNADLTLSVDDAVKQANNA